MARLHHFIEENLPFRESRKQYITRKHGNMWNLHRFDHPWYTSSRTAWALATRIIKAHVGKHVNLAFSDYMYQRKSWHAVEEFTWHLEPRRNRRWNAYFLDENGIICYENLKPKFYKFEKLSKHEINAIKKARKTRYTLTEEEFRYWLNYTQKE
jgi:hypothetical protein